MNERLRQFLTSQENLPIDKDGKELEFKIIEYEDRPTVIAISIDDTDYLYTLGEHRMYEIDGLNYGDLYCYKNEYTIEEYFNRVQRAYDRDPVITNVRDDSFAMICVNKCEEALGTLKGQDEAKEFRQTAIENTGNAEKNRNFFDAFKDWFEEKKEMLIEYWNIYKPSAKEVVVGTAVFVLGAAAAHTIVFGEDTNTPQPAEENNPKAYGHVVFYEGGNYDPSAKLEHEDTQLEEGDKMVYEAIREDVDHIIPQGPSSEENDKVNVEIAQSNVEKDSQESVKETVRLDGGTIESDIVKIEMPSSETVQTPSETPTESVEQSPSEVVDKVEDTVEEAQEVILNVAQEDKLSEETKNAFESNMNRGGY